VEEAFQNIPIPTLLLGPEDEILQHNTAFVKLNLTPSNVKKLSDMDQVTIKGQTWSVRRAELPSGQGHRPIYTFLPVRASFSGTSLASRGHELGIITSSIAHELNNPLAGLLTALELMSFEDHWDEESRQLLVEMKQGATRCKQLVDTFLGFSRLRTDTAPTAEKDLLRRSAEQALHLQRFRMVESGLRLQITLQQGHPYAYPLHGPSITMAIYLVLGEFMTALHHLKLLERQAAHGLVIEGIVLEDADNFRIRFTEKLPRALGFSSKLLQYLLQQERLVLTENGSEFIFTHQNVLI
jgi:signal transduction histidine kinase